MTDPDHPADHPGPPPRPPGISLAEAAQQLGISREAVRSRVRRGQLAGVQTVTGWVVMLPGPDQPLTTLRTTSEPVQTTPDQGADRPADRPADQPPDRAEHRDHADLVAQLRGEVERLSATLADTQAALARSQQGEAELRRLLAAEQQRRLPAPMDTTAAELPMEPAEPAENPPRAAASAGAPPVDLAQALKQAGVKKKQRRKLLERLAAVWRR